MPHGRLNPKVFREAYFISLFHAHHRRVAAIAIELRFRLCSEFYDAILSGIKRIITGADDALARQIFRAALADNDLADAYFLAMIYLDTQTLRGRFSSELG